MHFFESKIENESEIRRIGEPCDVVPLCEGN